jgi:hypothetical protein
VESVLVLALIVVVSLIARKAPKRFDLTSERAYALSSTTEDQLRGLRSDLTIWLNTDPGDVQDKSLGVALVRTAGILEEFRRRSPHVRVTLLGPGQVPDALHRQHWTTVSPATLYLLLDDKAKGKTNKKTLEIYSLFEGNAMTGELHHYRGEAVLAHAMRELGGDVKRFVYESQGHGELVTGDPQLQAFRQLMTANEGVEFRPLPTAEYKAVPPDCQVLLVMAPGKPFLAEELGLFRDYLERGGSMLVAVRPRTKTGLEALLEEYGVKVRDGIVHDPERYFMGRLSNLVVRDFNVHEINRGMANVQFAMPESTALEPIPLSPPQIWKITPLAMSSPRSWEEKDDPGSRTPPRPDPDERKGDLKLIVAVEKALAKGADDRPRTAKLVVWGSPLPFVSQVLYAQGTVQEVQYNYLVNHLRWLSERSMLEIKHDAVSVKPLDLSPAAIVQLRWVILVGFPAFGVLLGLFAWFMRRK